MAERGIGNRRMKDYFDLLMSGLLKINDFGFRRLAAVDLSAAFQRRVRRPLCRASRRDG
jgi:hypothetical protein